MSELMDLFAREFPVWHMVVRGTVVYWFLLLVFRFLLRRDIGSMGVADLLFVVLVADASSNAMQGEYKSINDGLVLLSTLIGWNYALDWLSFRFAPVARFLEPLPEVLVRHGRANRRALKREMVTMEELEGKLREQGVEDIAEVRIARLESDGTLSVFKIRTTNPDAPLKAAKAPRPPLQ
ncbi:MULTISPECIES: DUF421 domain-containing protein [unclassified Variovorax]|uniref:DUF421 domain-containing protein n=1 Tax=unclassified Variovorax TaxID=663243 RepID=UPI0008AFE0F8|nr:MULTISPECIES: YetF domain-containing protein [unclassified Variovorax]SEK17134.1 Uncharacterized membrane protein YcaP, DUF421 family [Variovorax sp. OK202]SFE73171.1 Uncharacterized membrane protein YcaP, DUF421 family [Variovorax sp. OK212]